VAQRLVRRLCKKCREEHKITPEALVDIGFSPEEAEKVTPYKAKGCAICSDTGYKGRVGLFEVMEVTNEIKDHILAKSQPKDVKEVALRNGMVSLRMSGLAKIKEGVTSIEEVLRETVRDTEVKSGDNDSGTS
jgi:type IV pilus assembly protein PilB